MNAVNFDVFLRIRHPDLDPDYVTLELGFEPEHHWRAGDLRPGTSGEAPGDRHAESYWIAPVRFPGMQERTAQLEPTLVLVAVTLKHRKALWQRLSAGGGRAELLVTVSSAGPASIDLSTELMSLLDGIGLNISFEPASARDAAA